MKKKEKNHLERNFSDKPIFNDEQIAIFATIKCAYEKNSGKFNNLLDFYKNRYNNLSTLKYELFVTSKDFKNNENKFITLNVNKQSNVFKGETLKINGTNHTGLKMGITSQKNAENKLTIFVGISGYQYYEPVDIPTVLITESKGVLQGQVIQAVSIISQFYNQIENKEAFSEIEWIFGGHSLGGNIIQLVAAILSLNNKDFKNRYSTIKSNPFKNKPFIRAKTVYTFNTLQPRVFLDKEFEFLKEKTVNFVINNDWLLRVLKSNNGSYIGEIKLYEKKLNLDKKYDFELLKVYDIPVNIKEKCVIYSSVRDDGSKNLVEKLAILFKSGRYGLKLFLNVFYKISHKHHAAINFIANGSKNWFQLIYDFCKGLLDRYIK